MTYLVGTDEAGYGPNLGPLVISATLWEVPEGVRSQDLYGRLSEVIASSPPLKGTQLFSRKELRPLGSRQSGQEGAGKVVLADSKALYQSGHGLAALERGLLAALAVLGRRPTRWQEAWDALAPESGPARRAAAWYRGFDRPLPLDADPADVEPLADALRRGLAACGVRLIAIHSRAILEEEFNRLVHEEGSKATVLSRATLGLVARLIEPLDQGPIAVLCDKHGGRNRYADLLGQCFPEWFVGVHGENRQRSVYRFGPAERRIEFSFVSKGESHLSAALASMASKYLREAAMLALNDFWCGRVPGLMPTAGYPADARRFKSAISAAQRELGIEDDRLWRRR
jgi:ribonuclease HII